MINQELRTPGLPPEIVIPPPDENRRITSFLLRTPSEHKAGRRRLLSPVAGIYDKNLIGLSHELVATASFCSVIKTLG